MLRVETYKPYLLVKGSNERDHVMLNLRLLADRVSEVDKEECRAVGKIPELTVYDCFFKSEEACLVFSRLGGVCIAAFGVIENTLVGSRTGTPWVFRSKQVNLRGRVALAFLSRQGVEQLMKHYDRLENCVYCKNTVAQKWLKWLGFTMTDRYVTSVTGEKFQYYYMEK